MKVHVITARIYTGSVFCLGRIPSGLLGSWCGSLAEAATFDAPAADQTLDALVTYLAHPVGRSQFDASVITSMYPKARVLELSTGTYDLGQDPVYGRRRLVSIFLPNDPLSSVIKHLAA